MRTFHTGGVAGDDITHGLPRIVELFEARTPKGVAPIAEAAGVVSFREDAKGKKIIVFKYKAKVRYRRKTGHRQKYSRVIVREIVAA